MLWRFPPLLWSTPFRYLGGVFMDYIYHIGFILLLLKKYRCSVHIRAMSNVWGWIIICFNLLNTKMSLFCATLEFLFYQIVEPKLGRAKQQHLCATPQRKPGINTLDLIPICLFSWKIGRKGVAALPRPQIIVFVCTSPHHLYASSKIPSVFFVLKPFFKILFPTPRSSFL